MMHTLEAGGIQLAFDTRTILSDIYVQATTGKITGLLGRNGEGKSCLMKIIYGTLKCEKSIRVDKRPCNEAYSQAGIMAYMPQFNFIPPSLSLKRIFKDFEIDFDLFLQRFPGFAAAYSSAAGALSGGELRLVELYIIVKRTVFFCVAG